MLSELINGDPGVLPARNVDSETLARGSRNGARKVFTTPSTKTNKQLTGKTASTRLSCQHPKIFSWLPTISRSRFCWTKHARVLLIWSNKWGRMSINFTLVNACHCINACCVHVIKSYIDSFDYMSWLKPIHQNLNRKSTNKKSHPCSSQFFFFFFGFCIR